MGDLYRLHGAALRQAAQATTRGQSQADAESAGQEVGHGGDLAATETSGAAARSTDAALGDRPAP